MVACTTTMMMTSSTGPQKLKSLTRAERGDLATLQSLYPKPLARAQTHFRVSMIIAHRVPTSMHPASNQIWVAKLKQGIIGAPSHLSSVNSRTIRHRLLRQTREETFRCHRSRQQCPTTANPGFRICLKGSWATVLRKENLVQGPVTKT